MSKALNNHTSFHLYVTRAFLCHYFVHVLNRSNPIVKITCLVWLKRWLNNKNRSASERIGLTHLDLCKICLVEFLKETEQQNL